MKWIIGLLFLCLLVILHEFGHFFAAKLFGVKVESFSVGFGPILFHKTINGTDFRVSLLPLGGYCGMKGEKDFRNAVENNLSKIDAESDSLYGIHPLKRVLIGFTGPFFNFLFAFFCFTLICGIGFKYYTFSNKIILGTEISSDPVTIAQDAGIKTGDKIIEINKKIVNDFSDIIEEISTRPDEIINIKVLRQNKIFEFTLKTQLDKKTGTGKIGIAADTSSFIEKESERYGFFDSIIQGFKQTVNSIWLTIKSIGILFKGIDLSNAVSGPVRITQMLGTAVTQGFSDGFRQGFVNQLNLLAIISISLFIMNLLPIPVLDGGMIFISFIEMIIRKKIHPKILFYIQFIGIAFILFVFFIGLKSDILFLIRK